MSKSQSQPLSAKSVPLLQGPLVGLMASVFFTAVMWLMARYSRQTGWPPRFSGRHRLAWNQFAEEAAWLGETGCLAIGLPLIGLCALWLAIRIRRRRKFRAELQSALEQHPLFASFAAAFRCVEVLPDLGTADDDAFFFRIMARLKAGGTRKLASIRFQQGQFARLVHDENGNSRWEPID